MPPHASGLRHLFPYPHAQAVDKGGYQQELPDIWLTDGNPWEVKRSEIKYEICFGGKTEKKNGVTVWLPNQKVGHVVGGGGGDGPHRMSGEAKQGLKQ